MEHFGAYDETSRLTAALVRSPGRELDGMTKQKAEGMLWPSRPNPERAREQHRELVEVLTENDVQVINIAGDSEYPNLCFCRDQFITMPKGHLLCRFAHSCRHGEEAIAAVALESAGVLPWQSRNCAGPYEGGDFLLIDDSIMLAGISKRTHWESIEILSDTLKQGGVSAVIPIPLPDEFLHLDCGVLPIGGRKVLSAFRFPAATHHFLEDQLGFQVVSVPPSWIGARGLGLNALFLNPELIVVSKSAPVPFIHFIRDEGVRPLFVDVSEFEKGRGSVHCLVAPISRRRLTACRASN
jgi:N-dimethylarginine dimethylaminohydrolase